MWNGARRARRRFNLIAVVVVCTACGSDDVAENTPRMVQSGLTQPTGSPGSITVVAPDHEVSNNLRVQIGQLKQKYDGESATAWSTQAQQLASALYKDIQSRNLRLQGKRAPAVVLSNVPALPISAQWSTYLQAKNAVLDPQSPAGRDQIQNLKGTLLYGKAP